MNKRITSLALVFVMVLSLLATAVPVLAADGVEFKMTADKTIVHPSTPEQEEIITFTVTMGKVSRLDSFKFKLPSIPEGLENHSLQIHLPRNFRGTIGSFKLVEGYGEDFIAAEKKAPAYEGPLPNAPSGAEEFDVL